MRVCVIGCGGHANQAHGPSQERYVRENPGVRLAGCCDIDLQRAEAYRSKFGFGNAYNNSEQMLDIERPDAVCVVLPTALTADVAVPLLERGYPVFLEKPPGASRVELDRMIAAAAKGGAPNQVAFNRRHMPVIRRAMEILEAEMPTGEVFRIDYEMVRCDRRDENFSTTAVHAIDAVRYLARSPFGIAHIRYAPFASLGPSVFGFEVSIDCEGGTRANIHIEPTAGRNFERIHIHAHRRSLSLEYPVNTPAGPGAALTFWRDDHRITSVEPSGSTRDLMGFYVQAKTFFDGIRTGSPMSPRLIDCVQQVDLMEAIRSCAGTVNWR